MERRGRSSSSSAKAASPPILSKAYLERHTSKNDLVRRLRNVVEALSDEDLEPNSPEHPGLPGLTTLLVQDAYLNHRDKDVRLHTVLACMEVFYLYAPEPPFDETEVLAVFAQMIRQLGNLAHCTGPTKSNFDNYLRLLEQLSEVKIGVILVELTRSLESAESPTLSQERMSGGKKKRSSEDDDEDEDEDDDGADGGDHHQDGDDTGPTSEDALEMLCDLIRTLLTSIRIEHPAEVQLHASSAIAACIEEFDGSVPIPVLDEILACIGAGPVTYVTNPEAVKAAAALAAEMKKAKRQGGKKAAAELAKKQSKAKLPPKEIQQTNPSYLVASSIVRRTEDRISTSIANLLNGLLNGDANVVSRSNISSAEVAEKAGSSGGPDVWTIVYELHRISPPVLTTVIGTVASSLLSPKVERRLRATRLLGRLFYSPSSDIGRQFRPCYRQWLGRGSDRDPTVRESMVKCLVSILRNKSGERELCREASSALVQTLLSDPTIDVRLGAVHSVCDLAHGAGGGSSASDGPASASSALSAGAGGGTTAVATSSSNTPPTSSSTSSSAIVSARLLRAVGDRVGSKNKTERRDALTGLSRIYHRQYILETLKLVQSGGDDCDIGLILDALRETCGSEDSNGHGGRRSSKNAKRRRPGNKSGSGNNDDGDDDADLFDLEEKYKWIPRKVFQSVCISDSSDPDMRNRVLQIVDDVLLGKGSSSGGDGNKSKQQALTPTSQAVGLAAIVHSLQHSDDESDDAYKWMCSLFRQRAALQHALGSYIDARTKARHCESGSAEALAADAEAMSRLEAVAALSAPLSSGSSSSSSSSPMDLSDVLQKLHNAKDKHIFRILATIAMPTHSASARARAFDELPKRTKSLGTATSTWVKSLARRCAMGNFLNVQTIEHCILLAQECFHEEECRAASIFLNCVKVATAIFPTLGGTKEGFGTLVELFGECRSVHEGQMKQDIEKYELVGLLTRILAASAPARAALALDASKAAASSPSKKKQKSKDEEAAPVVDPDLQQQLLKLCTRDGTPEQARHAVYTLAALVNPHTEGTNGGSSHDVQREIEAFEPLLKALASPSRLSLNSSGKKGGDDRLVSILCALAALAECAPFAFGAPRDGHGTGRGEKAITFALETVLLGRREAEDDESDSEEESSASSQEEGDESSSKTESGSKRRLSQGRRKSVGKAKKKRASSEKGRKSHDRREELSLPCKRACAAIELLVSHIRSSISRINACKGAKKRTSKTGSESDLKPPSASHISQVFSILIQMIEERGLPPSDVDRPQCKSTANRAALRQCAAVNLLRLCDASLQLGGSSLERSYLTPKMWVQLGSVFLDEENSVREAVMEELSSMLTGQGRYRPSGRQAFAPSLRFLAYVTLCVDGEHGHGHSVANGNAAYVGRSTARTKLAAQQCVTNLRTTCEQTLAVLRAQGRESYFENNLKMLLMPEYALPFSLSLLSLRRETPSAGGTDAGVPGASEEEDMVADEDARQRVLKKRLKWILEPLVLSLGESADNISFLLRMVEIANQYRPIDVSRNVVAASGAPSPGNDSFSSIMSPLGISLDDSLDFQEQLDTTLHAKLKCICAMAREVLLSFIKKDVNLTTYPGLIHIPGNLFARATAKSPTAAGSKTEVADETSIIKASSKKSTSTPGRKGHVTFSPDLQRNRGEEDDEDFGGVGFEADVEETEPEKKGSKRRTRRASRSSSTPQADRDDDDDDDDDFGGMSPIAKSDSPLSRGTQSPASTPGYRRSPRRRERDAEPVSASSEKPPRRTRRSKRLDEDATSEDDDAASPASSAPSSRRSPRRTSKEAVASMAPSTTPETRRSPRKRGVAASPTASPSQDSNAASPASSAPSPRRSIRRTSEGANASKTPSTTPGTRKSSRKRGAAASPTESSPVLRRSSRRSASKEEEATTASPAASTPESHRRSAIDETPSPLKDTASDDEVASEFSPTSPDDEKANRSTSKATPDSRSADSATPTPSPPTSGDKKRRAKSSGEGSNGKRRKKSAPTPILFKRPSLVSSGEKEKAKDKVAPSPRSRTARNKTKKAPKPQRDSEFDFSDEDDAFDEKEIEDEPVRGGRKKKGKPAKKSQMVKVTMTSRGRGSLKKKSPMSTSLTLNSPTVSLSSQESVDEKIETKTKSNGGSRRARRTRA